MSLYQSARIFTEPLIEVTLDSQEVVVKIEDGSNPVEITLDGQTVVWGDIEGSITNQVDLQSALDSKVDLAGDTMTGDLNFTGSGINQADYVEFNTSYNNGIVEGRVQWNDDDGTLELGLPGSNILADLVPMHERVVNKTGSPLLRGKVVYINGSQGNRPTVTYSTNATESGSSKTFGILEENINNNGSGYVITGGLFRDINTVGYTAGQTLYLGTNGDITNVKPVAPAHMVAVGKVLDVGATGSIYVTIQNGFELDELHNVYINPGTLANNDVLKYNSTSGLWENGVGGGGGGGITSISTSSPITGGTITTSGTIGITQATTSTDGYLSSTDWNTFNNKQNLLTNPVTGTGTSNELTYWTSSSAVGSLSTATYPSLTELSYVKGVTSSIQTQLNGKQATLTNPITGTGTSGQVAYFNGTTSLTSESNLFWDATNDRLGIRTATPSSPLHIVGTTATDGGQLGAELLTSSNWTSTGWTGDFATGFTHSTGNTTALTNTLAAVTNTYYQITWTVTNRTAGTFTIAFGGYTSGNLSATGNIGPRATSTGTLSITPTTDFNGTVVISIKVISAGSALISYASSGGTITNEVRLSTSNSNTFQGVNAGSRITTATGNIFYGFNSGANTTSGSSNVAIGRNSLVTNVLGSNNVSIGFNSLENNVNASNNTAVGWSVLNANTSGSGNSAYGLQASFSNTTGSNNSSFGQRALEANQSGGTNSAFGLQSLLNTTSSNNSAFGATSLVNNTSGSNNSAFGYNAGRYAGSGTTANQTSSNSLYLGYQTRASTSGNTNEVVIGYNVVGLGSNTTILGNSSTVTTGIYGNLLLGSTTDGGQRLQVTGTSLFTGAIQVGQSTTTISSVSEVITVQGRNNRSAFKITTGTIANLISDNSYLFEVNQNINSTTLTNISNTGITGSFSPSSGSVNYYANRILVTINQTGGANGITRGLYVNPTLTSAADWRSIETSNNTGYAAYFGGSADLFFNDATDLQFGTTTGTKIGTATSQKISFWNATPIVQPTTAVASATLVGGGGTALTDTDTFDGYTLSQIVKALRNTGLLA